MADNDNMNFVFYKSWFDIITEQVQDRAKQNELFRAIIEHGITGAAEFPSEVMFLKQAYVQIDSAKAKHQKRVEAGRKGGKAGRGKAKARYGNKNASKTQPNDNDNDNVNTNDSLSFVIIDNNPSGPLPDGSPSDYREKLEDELGDEYE